VLLAKYLDYRTAITNLKGSDEWQALNQTTQQEILKQEEFFKTLVGEVKDVDNIVTHINAEDFANIQPVVSVSRSGGSRAINNIKNLVNENQALVIKPVVESSLAQKVDEYVAAFNSGKNDLQGALGEEIAEMIAKELDNTEVLNIKINNSGHGFDILAFENGKNEPRIIRMIESKPLNGSSVELPNTNNGTQMSNQWQRAKISEMRASNDLDIQNIGDILFQNLSKIERYILTVDKEFKQVIIVKLDNF
jgi:hypothetical protein